eukprot:1435612-Amphidinium_carterae.1
MHPTARAIVCALSCVVRVAMLVTCVAILKPDMKGLSRTAARQHATGTSPNNRQRVRRSLPN